MAGAVLLWLLVFLLTLPLAPLRAQPAPPPPAVTVVPVPVRDVAPAYSYIGRVVAIQSVEIRARVTAFIQEIPVEQGSQVHAGEVLFRLQQSEFEAALQSAQAQLAAARAALQQSQAALQRSSQLRQEGVASQAALDQAQAARDQDQARVQEAQAAVAQAALNLSYTIISSPIDGRIGAITLTEGNLVTPSTPPLATVNQLDPIRVVFSVADRTLVSVQQRTGTTAQQVSQGLVVNLILPNGTTYAHPGRIAFLGNEVDRQTGTVSVYAEFPNPDALLLPGAFVRVRVHREAPQQRPLVPAAAVQTDRSGDFVLVVGQGNKVVQTPVKLGRQIDQEYIVEDGLSGGERVIIAGSQKVQPGQTVAPSVATPTASQPSTAGQEG